jgi:YD repeat-containing protein
MREERMMRCSFGWSVGWTLAAALVAMPIAHDAGAQTYPGKPVRIVVSTGAGGFIDVVARFFANKFAEKSGQPVTVENIAGAGGQLAADRVSKSAPDGSVLLVSNPGPITVGPHLGKTNYDPLTDLAPVALLATTPTGFAANSALPVTTFQEFIAYARARPGALSYSHSGHGALMHLGGELLKAMAGIDMVGVPYRGAPAAGSAVFAGDVPVGFADLPSLLSLTASDRGKMRILALADPARTAFAPEIPTIAESGVPGYDAGGWTMMLAPVGTPKAVVDLLNAEAKRIFDLPDVRAALLKAAIDPAVISVDETGRFLRLQYDKWGKVIRDANIKAQ